MNGENSPLTGYTFVVIRKPWWLVHRASKWPLHPFWVSLESVQPQIID